MPTQFKAHGHNPSQMPIVVCWDLGKNRQVKLGDTNLSWKFTAEVGDAKVRVYVLARMPNMLVRAGEPQRRVT